MAINVYINTESGRVTNAIVNGVKRPAQPVTMPAFIVGTETPVNLYLVRDDGTFDSRSGSNAVNVAVNVGPAGATAQGGTYTLTDGSETTGAIHIGAQAQTVEAIINQTDGGNGLHSDLVDVTPLAAGAYRLTWRTNGAKAALTGTSIDLYPASTINAAILVAGDSSTRCQQLVEVNRTPLVNQETWNLVTNGFTGTITVNGLSEFAGQGQGHGHAYGHTKANSHSEIHRRQSVESIFEVKIDDEKICSAPVRILPSVSS